MYDRIKDLLIGESDAPRRGESREAFLKRVGSRAHAEMKGEGPRERATPQTIVAAVRGGRNNPPTRG